MRVAVIPARGGSRRIPRKNVRDFCGKPIIAYSIEAARSSNLFDDVWVSSNDPAIGRTAQRYGATWLWRDEQLSMDEVGTQEVTRDAIEGLVHLGQVESACCIYATAPTMTAADLKRGYDAMLAREDYAYIHGWFYWGMAQWFVERRPLAPERELARPVGRWVDINEEADWAKALQIYAELEGA